MSGRRPGGLGAEYALLAARDRRWVACGAVLGPVLGGIGGVLAGWPLAGRASSAGGVAWALSVLALAVYGACSAWLTVTDLRAQRLPNPVVAWGSAVVIGGLAVALLLLGEAERVVAAAGVAGLALLLFLALWFRFPHSVGAGDVKLAPVTACVAAIPGPQSALVLYLGGIGLLGLIFAVLTLVRARSTFSFGPVLLLSSWLSFTLGPLFFAAPW